MRLSDIALARWVAGWINVRDRGWVRVRSGVRDVVRVKGGFRVRGRVGVVVGMLL